VRGFESAALVRRTCRKLDYSCNAMPSARNAMET
jgi:hypothetical protein